MIDDYKQFLQYFRRSKDVPYSQIWEDMFGSPSGAITDTTITEPSRSQDRMGRKIVIIPAPEGNRVYVQTFALEENFTCVNDHDSLY